MQEQWKPIKGYEGLYEISNLGRIRSLSRWVSNKRGIWEKPEKILVGFIDKYGYKVTCLKGKIKKYHLVVWDYFGDRPRNGRKLQVDHIDGNKLNNRIDNLQLLTNRENVSKGYQDKGRLLPTGVSWHNQLNKYRSRIRVNGVATHIGVYDNIHDARLAYQSKLQEIKSARSN